MYRLNCLLMLIGICALGNSHAASGDEWTTIRGRFVYDGQAPQPAPLEITRDEDFCGPFRLKNESLLVNPKSNGLQHVAIFLRTKKDVAIHPSYATAKEKAVRLDNVECRFVPRMQVLRTGQTWEAASTDTIPHNVAVYAQRNDAFSQIVPVGRPLERVFAKAESRPVRIDCSIHAWMRAWVIITDHPYAAATDEDGRFEIAHVPQGKWSFRLWHERPGYIRELKRDGNVYKLKAGMWELDVTGKTLDLGDLRVSAAIFEE